MNNIVSRSRSGRAALLCLAVLFLLVQPYVLMGADHFLKIVEEGIFQEGADGPMWKVERSKRLKSGEEVEAYLKSVNEGKYQDWRLPTREELYDLFSLFDLKENGDVKIRLEGGYWLAGKTMSMQVGAWEIGDQCGPSRQYFTKKEGYVRVIRP